jgi:hypothetical protein
MFALRKRANCKLCAAVHMHVVPAPCCLCVLHCALGATDYYCRLWACGLWLSDKKAPLSAYMYITRLLLNYKGYRAGAVGGRGPRGGRQRRAWPRHGAAAARRRSSSQ